MKDCYLGWGRGGKTDLWGQALTFPAGNPRMWLSAMRLGPFEDAGCSWWIDGRTMGRGCNLRGESRLGGVPRGRLGSRGSGG